MISHQLLRALLTGEVGVVVVCLTTVAVHALMLWRRQRADLPRLAQGRAALAAAVIGVPDVDMGRVAELRRLPRRLRRRVVEELAVSVSGEVGRRVGQVAESLGLSTEARRRCASRWWWRRLAGAHQLNVHGGGDEILPGLLDDPHPAVRAQVIEWAGDARREDLASRLVSSLQDPSALCRNTAADSILRAGAPLVDALARELSSRGGREQADLLTLLARRPDPRYRRPSLAAARDDLPALRAAAAAVLGGVGGTEATMALRSLLADPSADVRAAAADALGRLVDQEAAPELAPLLRDPSFAVRHAAGAALAALGPGGTLLLRHYVSDADQFAAAMARHSLDVAALYTSGLGPPGH